MADLSSDTSANIGNVALIFGASGITGYALMSTLLSYPTPRTFSRIIGLTNRPLSLEDSLLPQDGRLELYSGLDLLDREHFIHRLADISGIECVTHVYFAAYTGHGSSYSELRRVNELVLTNAVEGVEKSCPNLKFFTLQTGGKAYGAEFYGKVDFNPPLRETTPRIPEPYAQNIFYYAQVDIMARASANKPWSFCEIRPDAIIGFVPQGNAMNLAQELALFLSLWAHVEGPSRPVPFPGPDAVWRALHTDTSQDILARFHVFASLHPDKVGGGVAVNVADGPATTWEAVWPRLCEWFGLRGVGPASGGAGEQGFDARAWAEAHEGAFKEWIEKNELRERTIKGDSLSFMQQMMSLPFRRDYDISRSRELGFTEERPYWEGYYRCFSKMREAKLIP